MKDLNYICKESFSVQVCDGDGFSIENKYRTTKVGTIWRNLEDGYRICGGEIRLVLVDDRKLDWMEISKEHLEQYFEEYSGPDVCPFCGSSKVNIRNNKQGYIQTDIALKAIRKYSVRCNRCRARGPVRDSSEEAIKEWNFRSDTN